MSLADAYAKIFSKAPIYAEQEKKAILARAVDCKHLKVRDVVDKGSFLQGVCENCELIVYKRKELK